MGLKSEALAADEERFFKVEDLVSYYKKNDIHLRQGEVQIKLISPHMQCVANAD